MVILDDIAKNGSSVRGYILKGRPSPEERALVSNITILILVNILASALFLLLLVQSLVLPHKDEAAYDTTHHINYFSKPSS
jgi:hypothetical protein